jgi:hypothetical protein
MATGSDKEPVAGFRDHENELPDPIKVRDFLLLLAEQLLQVTTKNDSSV